MTSRSAWLKQTLGSLWPMSEEGAKPRQPTAARQAASGAWLHAVEASPAQGSEFTDDARSADHLGLLDLWLEDFNTYDRSLWQPGLWAVVTHRLGRRARRLRPPWMRAAVEPVYQLLFTGVDWAFGIHLPRQVELGRRVRIWHSGCVVLNARMIGDDVHLRHNTTFGPVRAANDDDLPVIGARVEMGSGACVLGAVTVGEGATVAANSVVMKSVAPGALAMGVPARVVPV